MSQNFLAKFLLLSILNSLQFKLFFEDLKYLPLVSFVYLFLSLLPFKYFFSSLSIGYPGLVVSWKKSLPFNIELIPHRSQFLVLLHILIPTGLLLLLPSLFYLFQHFKVIFPPSHVSHKKGDFIFIFFLHHFFCLSNWHLYLNSVFIDNLLLNNSCFSCWFLL